MRQFTSIMLLSMAMIMSPSANAADPSAPVLLEQAKKALEGKDYDKAIDLYQQSQKLLPLNAEIPYNLAVAQYRKGDYEQSAESLKQALSLTNNPALRARSTYNLGNAAYAQTLRAMAGGADPQQAAEQSKGAQQYLKEAIEQYKKAIDENPKDEDAKANAELSQRLLTELQKQEQQQQQQQQQNQQQNQDQKDQQQQQQSSAQSQPQSQPDQNQQQQDQQQQQNQDQQQSQDQKQDQKDQQQQDQQQQDQQKQDQQKQDQKQSDQNKQDKDQQPQPQDAQKPQDGKNEKKGMSRDAAERLLQAVRDKEKQRRAELARREAAKYAPVDKDW